MQRLWDRQPADNTIDSSSNDGANAYLAAGFYEYLGEHYGPAAANYESRVAKLARAIYQGFRTDGLTSALGVTSDELFGYLLDFYIAEFGDQASNQTALPQRFRNFDESTLHGASTPSLVAVRIRGTRHTRIPGA